MTIDYGNKNVDINDIVYLESLTKDYRGIVNKLTDAYTEEAEVKAQLQILIGKVKSLQEQNKLIQEQIRVQKKRIDNLPK